MIGVNRSDGENNVEREGEMESDGMKKRRTNFHEEL